MKLGLALGVGVFVLAACSGEKDDTPIVPTEIDASSSADGPGTCGDTMNDPANCGWCGHDCGGATCGDGRCSPTELARSGIGGVGARRIDVDGGFVYWTNSPPSCGAGGGTCDGVMKCRTSGCAQSPTQFGTFLEPDWLDVVSGYALTASASGGALHRCSVDGCGSAPAAPATLTAVQFLVADANRVAWNDLSTVNSCPNSDASCPTPTLIATVPSGQQYRAALAVSDGTLYFATASTVYAAPIDGSAAARVVVAGLGGVFGLAADSTHVYYGAAGEVGRCPIGGCASPTILATTQSVARGVKVDSQHVYFYLQNGGNADAIERCPKAGCVAPADRQVVMVDRIFDFAIDDTSVYYVQGGVRSVRK